MCCLSFKNKKSSVLQKDKLSISCYTNIVPLLESFQVKETNLSRKVENRLDTQKSKYIHWFAFH